VDGNVGHTYPPALQSKSEWGYTSSSRFYGYEESSVDLSELSAQTWLIISASLLVLGVVLGWLMGRRTSTASQKYREVERKLDQVLQDKKVYEDEVVEHFTETAQLLNKLTENYRDVHNHLASGADTLCQGEGSVALARLQNNRDRSEMADVQQPLDYAPKTSPDEKGMLNEEFGLERKPVPEHAKEITKD
jgi:uncharacterized membrane-anchored protein YhcB (DUF1043 family)